MINAGILEGSRLGPLIFIMYKNDIKSDLESEIIIFADGTTLMATGLNEVKTSAQITISQQCSFFITYTWRQAGTSCCGAFN